MIFLSIHVYGHIEHLPAVYISIVVITTTFFVVFSEMDECLAYLSGYDCAICTDEQEGKNEDLSSIGERHSNVVFTVMVGEKAKQLLCKVRQKTRVKYN